MKRKKNIDQSWRMRENKRIKGEKPAKKERQKEEKQEEKKKKRERERGRGLGLTRGCVGSLFFDLHKTKWRTNARKKPYNGRPKIQLLGWRKMDLKNIYSCLHVHTRLMEKLCYF